MSLRGAAIAGLVTTTVALTLAAPVAAQEGQVSATAPQQAPDDALGLAPKAKIVASWPRVSLVRKAPPSHGATPRAKVAQAPVGPPPKTIDAGGVPAESVTSARPSPFLRFFKSTPHPRPGQPVTLSGVESSDPDGSIVAFKWRAQYIAGGTLNVVASEQPVFAVTTAADTTQVDATLTVTDNDGRQSQAAVSVKVVPNTPPKVELSRLRQVMECETVLTPAAPTGAPVFKSVHAAPISKTLADALKSLPATGGRRVSVYANGCDADGGIVRYQFENLNGSYFGPSSPEAATATGNDFWQPLVSRGAPVGVIPSDEARGFVEFRVTATDDEGASTSAVLKLKVNSPCDPVDQRAGQLGVRPLTACVEKKQGTPTTTETIPIGSDGGSFLVRGVEFTVAPRPSGQSAGKVSWDHATRTGLIDVDAGAVTAVGRAGERLDLPAGRILWRIDGNTGRVLDDGGFRWEGATLGGLKLSSLENFELAAPQFGASPLFGFQADVVAEAPGEFNPTKGSGTTTPQQPVHFDADLRGQAGAAATGVAAQSGGFKLGPQDMEIGGVSMKNAFMSFNGDDTWEIGGTFKLEQPIPIPQEISAAAGIQNGGLWYLDVSTDFPGSGIQIPGTGVNIDGLRFTLDHGKGIETTCVPRIGVKKLDFFVARQLFALFGYGGGDPNSKALYDFLPDYTLDYGKPEFQACGQVTFNTLAKVAGKTLAEGTLAVGVADYAGYSVFRVVGKPMKLIGIPSELLFELYSDGYIHLNAGAKATFAGGKVSASAEFDFAARFPAFNAQASAEVCVHVMDIGCASATALVSSNGFGACLEIDVLMFEFSPGATVVFKGPNAGFTPYLDGCDVGDVKVGIKSPGGPKSEKIPWPGGQGAVAAQSRPGDRFGKGETSVLTVDRGSTGAVFAVQGAPGGPQGPASRLGGANNLTRFRLQAPNGAAIDVDDVPSQSRVLRPIDMQDPSAPKFRIIKAPAEGVTNVIVPRAAAGDWKVTILGDRPAAKVRVSQGVPEPVAGARLQRAGSQRVLTNLRFRDRREDIVARLFDRGASGVRAIGEYKLTAGETTRVPSLRFQPAARKPEPRVIEVFFERRGIPVGYQRLGTYQSSAPPPPPAPRDVRVTRTAKTLTARWDAVAGAAQYEVLVTTNDGRRMAFTTRSARITESMPFQRHDAVSVRVRAVSRLGRAGGVASDRVAARGSKPTVRFTPAQRRALARMGRR